MSDTSSHFPPMRPVIEEGAELVLSTFIRKPNGDPLLAGDVESWSFKVYDRQSVSEDVAVYSSAPLSPDATNADGSLIVQPSVNTDSYSRHPNGYTFLQKLAPSTLYGAQGGHTYSHVLSFTSPSEDGGAVVYVPAEVAVSPRYG